MGDRLTDGGAGDGDTEFDGSADGIGDKVCILVHGSCGVFGCGVRTCILTSRALCMPLHLVSHRIIAVSTSCTPDPEEPVNYLQNYSGRISSPKFLLRCLVLRERLMRGQLGVERRTRIICWTGDPRSPCVTETL